jgi:hypothetical protein
MKPSTEFMPWAEHRLLSDFLDSKVETLQLKAVSVKVVLP